MSIIDRLARLSDRGFDALRDKRAFALTDDEAISGDIFSLAGHRYALVVTFRRNGEAVPSPVWFGVDDAGIAYFKTRSDAGKAKRLRVDSRVLIAPSTSRGRPLAPAIRATGRLLPEGEWPHAEATLAAAYGTGRRVSERLLGGPDALAAYIEVTAR